jgi:hypothetical protein
MDLNIKDDITPTLDVPNKRGRPRKNDVDVAPITLIMRKYYEKYRDKRNIRNKEYYLLNKDKIKAYERERYKNDPVYRERKKKNPQIIIKN